MKAIWLIAILLLSTCSIQAQTGAWPYSEQLDSSAVPARIRMVMHKFARKPSYIVWRRDYGARNITHSFTANFKQKTEECWAEVSPKGVILSFQRPVTLSACPVTVQHAVSTRFKNIKDASTMITIRILQCRIAGETGYSITYHMKTRGKLWEMFDEFYFDKNDKEEKAGN